MHNIIKNIESITQKPKKHSLDYGFTLLELAIVITILGLLTAATMTGVSLLQTAKLRAVITEMESYQIALNNFQTQYGSLPGDLKNASSFWTTAQNGGVGVFNGNGDGHITDGIYGNDSSEAMAVWCHLSLAKLIPQTFNHCADYYTVLPSSRYLNRSLYYFKHEPSDFANDISWNNQITGYAAFVDMSKVNHFMHVEFRPYNPGGDNSLFTPADAYYIDSKIDDGKPNHGKMFAGSGSACLSNVVWNQPDYYIAYPSPACALLINIDN